MKLNNQGWGYRMMALLMSILVIFLIIAIFYIQRFYNSIDDGYNNKVNSSYLER